METIKAQFQMELNFMRTWKDKDGENHNSNQQTALKYKEWLVANSTTFDFVNKEESKIISKSTDSKIKSCYYNCMKGMYPKKYKYFEGYVAMKKIPIPLEHAWLVNKKGEVIDPTLIINSPNDSDRTDSEYFGVEIDKFWLTKKCLKNKKSGPYLLEWVLEKIDG